MASNLAQVLAERVLLVDADLRNGTVHRAFALERGPRLSEVIAGMARLEEALHREVTPGVDVLTQGSVAGIVEHEVNGSW